MPYLYLIGGFVLLGLGGEMVVRGAVDLAARLGVTKLFIGLVIVAFGTSLPEMVVAVDAVLAGSPDIAIGNAMGSNIANILLVLGLGAVIFPIACSQDVVNRDVVVMIAVTGFFIWLADRGYVYQLQGLFMLGTLIVYLIYAYIDERLHAYSVGTLAYNIEVQDDFAIKRMRFGPLIDFLSVGAGIAFLVFGADILVEGATTLARQFGITEAMIGLTIVAVGTSLPEIATMIIAALRKHPEVAVGGIIGSNIFNLLAVVGIAGVFAPIDINPAFMETHVWVMLGAALIILPFMISRWRITRLEGLLLLSAYALYVYSIYDGLVLPF